MSIGQKMTVKEYNDIVELWADPLYRFVLSNCRDKDLAQDIIQDSFEKFWLKKDEIDKTKAKTYLFTTAHNKLIDHIRKHKRLVINDNILDSGIKSEYSDLNEVLHNAISQLPEIQRSVILLRDYEGYSYEEIATITNLSLEQVKVYIFRGRKFLQNYLKSVESLI